MNPQISLPRQHGGPSPFGSTPARGASIRMPRFFKRCVGIVYRNEDADGGYGLTARRLFKFPQMDFEMAIWEMTSLLIAPKKVFKSIYYHVSAGYYWMGPRTGQDC